MNRQWLYAKQPLGKIAADTFEWTETAIPVPRDGEALVRTHMLSLDPANRAWMMGKTYRDALEPGQVMSGFAIGEVVESKTAGLKAGDIVIQQATNHAWVNRSNAVCKIAFILIDAHDPLAKAG